MLRIPRRTHRVLATPILLTIALQLVAQSTGPARVQAVRFWSFGDVTRIAIQTEGEYKLFSDQIDNPSRLYFDLTGLLPPPTAHRGVQTIQVNDHLVKQIRIAEVSPGKTRIVFDLVAPVQAVSSQLVNPDRLMIELHPKDPGTQGLSVAHSVTASQRVDLSASNSGAGNVSDDSIQTFVAPKEPLLVLDRQLFLLSTLQLQPLPAQPAATHVIAGELATPGVNVATREAAPTSAPKGRPLTAPAKIDSTGDRSLVRVFGLKLGRVVIDAGHGGHDTGTIGPNGLTEKDLVLDVALRLGKLITRQMGADVVYTRSSDVFIPLEDRTRIANEQKADLFISIHANSSPDGSATGVETYYFNLTSDRAGLDLAMRENATSTSSISDLNDLLHRAVLEAKLEESRDFAQKVQTSLWAASVKMNTRSKNRGVRQAPFVVLIGAMMPSILAEIGFVSNAHDARLLIRNDQRQKIAEALFKGISQYANSLSHTQLARAGS